MLGRRSARRVLGAATLLMIVMAPVAAGAVPDEGLPFYLLGVGVLMGLAAALARRSRLAAAQRLVLALAAFCLTLGLADVVFRPLLAPFLYYRPYERYIERFPPLPVLPRYAANVSYSGPTYGDLAALAGDRRVRQYRDIRFVTDRFGFRNEPTAGGPTERDAEVVILGDSFGVGDGTTQEHTWTTRLQRAYGLEIYNLSVPGSPWQEFMTLALESNRLRTRRGAVLVWALVGANDLDEYYPGDLSQLPWNGPFGTLLQSFKTFQGRSPVRLALQRFRYASRAPRVLVRDLGNGKTVLFLPEYAERARRSRGDIVTHRNFTSFSATFAATVELARLKALTLTVLAVPSKEEIYSWLLDGVPPWSTPRSPSGFSTVLNEMAELAGVRFLDLAPLLTDASRAAFENSGELLWWDDDTHWNVRGHAVVAAVIYERLLAPLLRPAAGAPERPSGAGRSSAAAAFTVPGALAAIGVESHREPRFD